MGRWLRAAVTTAVAAAFAATLFSWAFSYRRSHMVAFIVRPRWTSALQAGRGQVNIQWVLYPTGLFPPPPPGEKRVIAYVSTSRPAKLVFSRGFWTSIGFYLYRSPPPLSGTTIIVPHWFVLLLVSPLVAWRVRPWLRRRRRLRRGLCPRCGYDLTANATGVCPECGTAVPARAAAETAPHAAGKGA